MKNKKHKKNSEKFYGATTLGEKGQIVIPCEARKNMELKAGDKLLVFGIGKDMIAFTKLSKIEKFASSLAEQLETIRTILEKSESRKK